MNINNMMPLFVTSFLSLLLEICVLRLGANILQCNESHCAEEINHNTSNDTPSDENMVFRYNPLLLVISFGMALGIAFMLKYYYESFLLDIVLTVTFISMLSPVSFVDYKRHLIPNELLAVMFLVRLAIFAGQFFFDREYLAYYAITSIIAALGMVLASGLCRVISSNSIGLGDIKLLGIAGFYMGLDKIGSMMLVTLIIMFIASSYLLLVRKVPKNTEMAFAPYLLVGTILSAFLMGV